MRRNKMNYNKHLEQLNKFLDEIRNTQQTIDGLGIELGNYIVEVEKMRDDADRKGGKIPPEDFSTRTYTKKAFGKKDDDVIKADPVNEALDNWYKKLTKV
jgi:hypothetical protein